MKNIFLAAMAATTLLASCSKATEDLADLTTGSVIRITLTDKRPVTTRAFFDETAAAESWEKKINTLTLFVFDIANNTVLQRNFTAAEIDAQAAVISIPEAMSGQTYKFYVVANAGGRKTVANLDELKRTTESEAASYNGPFGQVTTKALRDEGFTLVGSAAKSIVQTGQTTDVQIGLERLVAKIAVQTATDSKFAEAYPGRVHIISATVSRAASSSVYFNEPHSGGATNRSVIVQDFSHTQTAQEQNGKYANLFYIYGNESTYPSKNVLLTLTGIYDGDGDLATSEDQIPVSYEVELQGDNGPAISRNTYRRVSVNISGLTGAGVAVTISPADWEGPFDQDISLGM